MSDSADGHRLGAAGEAAVAARLLQSGFDVARPAPDRGVDLLAVARDMTRVVPIQVNTLGAPRITFQRAWFSPIDVLRIINDLNSSGSRELSSPDQRDVPPCLDVNNDRYVSPVDALLIVNYLNQVNAAT